MKKHTVRLSCGCCGREMKPLLDKERFTKLVRVLISDKEELNQVECSFICPDCFASTSVRFLTKPEQGELLGRILNVYNRPPITFKPKK